MSMPAAAPAAPTAVRVLARLARHAHVDGPHARVVHTVDHGNAWRRGKRGSRASSRCWSAHMHAHRQCRCRAASRSPACAKHTRTVTPRPRTHNGGAREQARRSASNRAAPAARHVQPPSPLSRPGSAHRTGCMTRSAPARWSEAPACMRPEHTAVRWRAHTPARPNMRTVTGSSLAMGPHATLAHSNARSKPRGRAQHARRRAQVRPAWSRAPHVTAGTIYIYIFISRKPLFLPGGMMSFTDKRTLGVNISRLKPAVLKAVVACVRQVCVCV
jgi:hypothetical protein